ncbi:MAG: VacJ family lipoprotein [Parvularculaceae bacterium]
MAIAAALVVAPFVVAPLVAAPAHAQTTPLIDPENLDAAAAAKATNGDVADPWIGFNRKMFAVNTFIDDNFLVPSAKVYRATTPKKGRRGIRRFLANLRAPGIFINDLLQGEFKRAGETAGRFFVNSTIGAGGFADPSAELIAPAHSEDFGQTLAVWGFDSGPYLFLPLLGPSSPRDGFGSGVQILLDPHTFVRTPPANIARFTRAGVGGVSAREPLIEPLAEIRANSLDYYASFRSFYLQAREREIKNGRTDYSDLPDIGDFDEFDELE